MQKKSNRIAVIGGGISGLSASMLLAKSGFQVDVFEKSSHLGGKISELRGQGFRFDAGPSLLTLPYLYDELFEGTLPITNKLGYVRLDTICRYFYPDGKVVNAYSRPEKFALELQHVLGENAENVLDYLNKAQKLYDNVSDLFIFNSMHDFQTYKNAGLGALQSVFELDALRTFHRLNQKSFISPYTVQLFDRYATYNGSDPFKAPATLKVIAHLEHNTGAYFPVSGMYSLVENIHEKGMALGVGFNLEDAVLEVSHGKKGGVEVVSEKKEGIYDAAICAIDVHYFYKYIFRDIKMPRKIKKATPSSSAIVFYWGINNEFKALDLHNILFSDDYKAEFDHLFNKKMMFGDPTVYIFISSKKVPGDAPKGSENWFVMVNAPADNGQDWKQLVSNTRKNVIGKINNMLKTDIEKHIVFEEINHPVAIYERTSSMYGAIYGSSSNSMMSAFNRHPNYTPKTKNIYFTGGSVHPGGGIPLCIASANIVVKKILSRYAKGKKSV
jgi:phytoene desaturase